MADYGLVVRNASLDVQIDGTYRNHSFVKAKSVSVVGGNNLNATFGDIDTRPIVTHELLTATPLSLYRVYKFGSASYIGCSFTYPFGNALTVDLQVFKQGVNTLPDYGLIVNNASGNTVFSSEDKHLTFLNNYEATLGHGSETASIDITVGDADNNNFILEPFVHKEFVAGNPANSGHQFRGIRKIDASTVRVVNFSAEYPPGPAFPSTNAWVATLNVIEVRKE